MSILKTGLIVGGSLIAGATLGYTFNDKLGDALSKMPWNKVPENLPPAGDATTTISGVLAGTSEGLTKALAKVI